MNILENIKLFILIYKEESISTLQKYLLLDQIIKYQQWLVIPSLLISCVYFTNVFLLACLIVDVIIFYVVVDVKNFISEIIVSNSIKNIEQSVSDQVDKIKKLK